jgi:hypothetical protein
MHTHDIPVIDNGEVLAVEQNVNVGARISCLRIDRHHPTEEMGCNIAARTVVPSPLDAISSIGR